MTVGSQALVLRPGEGHAFHIGGDRVLVKALSEIDGGFGLIDYRAAPANPGPPLHVHRTFEELWYVPEGEVHFRVDQFIGRPGMWLFIPRGVTHTFSVPGSQPARWLGILSPGGSCACSSSSAR